MIAVDNLVFEYPGLRALDQVSFQIYAGSITALVGPNGAGKTTLLRCLAGLDVPVAGSIRIGEIDVLEQPRTCHRFIGYLSDAFGLYQRLSVRQCLHYAARAQGLEEEQSLAAIGEVSRALHIEDRLEMRPGELSRGLRQRVAIAQAIIHRPKVLLLDEPASGLDPEARHELEQLFIALQRRGMTLLVSSHILAELEAYCSDMLILRQGRMIEQIAIKAQSQGTTYQIALAFAVDQLAERLQSIAGISVLNTEAGRVAQIRIPDDPAHRHQILKMLLAINLPVSEFSPLNTNLQDAYLQTIKLN